MHALATDYDRPKLANYSGSGLPWKPLGNGFSVIYNISKAISWTTGYLVGWSLKEDVPAECCHIEHVPYTQFLTS